MKLNNYSSDEDGCIFVVVDMLLVCMNTTVQFCMQYARMYINRECWNMIHGSESKLQ